jgi:hypothetical protein
MNKKAQVGDWEEIIKLIIVVPILIAIIGAFAVAFSAFNKECPTCDCSGYQINLTNCTRLVSNLTQQINETPIRYINVTIEKEVPVQEIVYKDNPVSITLISLTFILSLILTIKLFKIEIKLPKEIEEKLKEIERIILTVKVLSLIVTLFILIKLIIILISLI